jgi:hypothetical protein
MTETSLQMLMQMLEGDREILELLREMDLVAADCQSFGAEQVECALVARTLMRELEVNPPGVEIILRMRSQMLAMQRQLAELLAVLRSTREPTGGR